jgi:hypothetical protein
LREIRTYEQLLEITAEHSFYEWVYKDFQKAKFPFYYVEVPILMSDGRQREINRKERMNWLRDKGVKTPEDRKLLHHCLHVWGKHFFDDYLVALEFELRFA